MMVRFSPIAAAQTGSAAQLNTFYYLTWRPRASQPWQSEEFANRFEAHRKYFALLARDIEVTLEIRRPAGSGRLEVTSG